MFTKKGVSNNEHSFLGSVRIKACSMQFYPTIQSLTIGYGIESARFLGSRISHALSFP